jgi:hypothetical protein
MVLPHPTYNSIRSKTLFANKLFLFCATTMVQSSFGHYHGLWCKDSQSECNIIPPTSGRMIRALGLGILMLQPKLYQAYGTAIFHDFFVHNIKMIVINNMVLDY